jgi:uncharacterized protein (DUF342 family)
MVAYFVNPPALGNYTVPTPFTVINLLKSEGVCAGIEYEAIEEMCRDLVTGALRESCVRIARGTSPKVSKGQLQFLFEVLPSLVFEKFHKWIQSSEMPDPSLFEGDVAAVSKDFVLAEQVPQDDKGGCDLFGRSVAAPGGDPKKKTYVAGPNVRREVRDGRMCFVAETHGYAGVVGNRIEVVSPLWISADRMSAYIIILQTGKKWVWASTDEVYALLERGSIRFGIDDKIIEGLVSSPGERPFGCVCIAQGDSPKKGQDGRVELMFNSLPDPGKLLEDGKIDFYSRDSVPQIHAGELIAKRRYPKEGEPGRNIRGRLIKPPKIQRELLFAGPGVRREDDEDGQLFFASKMGWARVVKETLSVQQRFSHTGDVDFHLGNIKMEGDVEIDGSIKSHFRVEASGDVYVTGALESSAEIIAGGNVVIQRGVIGAKIKTGGDLHARFIQESTIEVGGSLWVRNYIQESQIQVVEKAFIQGNDGGARHLCLLGGTLFAGKGVETSSLGASYGRPTRVLTGIDVVAEGEIKRYRDGQAFCDLQMRRAIRGLGAFAQGGAAVIATISKLPDKRKQYVLKQLKDLYGLKQLGKSLKYHMAEFEEQRETVASQARIKVTNIAYSKVTLQIGNLHQTLDTEIPHVVFHLNGKADAIVQEDMGKHL